MNPELYVRIKNALQGASSAYLFGSAARGEDDGYSDIDLMIVKDTDLDFFHRHQEFPGIYELDRAVDLLIYTPKEFEKMKKQGNKFITHILETGKKLL